MTTDAKLPRAVHEALSDPEAAAPNAAASEQQAQVLLDELATLLDPSTPSPELEARLLGEISRAPLRYAPFFSRLSALFDVDESAMEERMAILADAKSWKRTGLKGVERILIGPGPRLASASTSFVRFAAGAHFPRHYHLGFEQVFVLEGSYTDDTGVRHGPGDLHEMAADTEHEFWVGDSEPCIAASVLHRGLRFRQWPEKFFNLFMKR